LSAFGRENTAKYASGEEAALRRRAWPSWEGAICACCHITAVLKAVNLGPKANIALSYRGHKIHEVSAFKSDHRIA
jgi:hypothetical protein